MCHYQIIFLCDAIGNAPDILQHLLVRTEFLVHGVHGSTQKISNFAKSFTYYVNPYIIKTTSQIGIEGLPSLTDTGYTIESNFN